MGFIWIKLDQRVHLCEPHLKICPKRVRPLIIHTEILLTGHGQGTRELHTLGSFPLSVCKKEPEYEALDLFSFRFGTSRNIYSA